MNSTLIIAKNIKIDKTYNNILSYSSSEMLELVEKNKVAKSTDFSFIRGTGTVKTSFNYSDAIKCNYMAFQNEDFSNKWFFAFIDSIEYKGNNNTIIHYTIDAWSTFYKDLKITESFVLREHVNDDVIGNYTLNEDIGVGEVVCLGYETEESVAGKYNFICVMSSYNPATGKDYDGITVYNKEVFGTDLFFIRANNYDSIRDLLGFILKTNIDTKINSITNIFYIPQGLLNLSELEYYDFEVKTEKGTETFGFYKTKSSMTQEIITHNIEKVHSFSDYTPRNNKCFCYPYNYLYVTNNAGRK